MIVNDKHMAESTEKDFSNATELVDYSGLQRLPFREAHEIVGELALSVPELVIIFRIPNYQGVSDLIEEDIYETLKISYSC